MTAIAVRLTDRSVGLWPLREPPNVPKGVLLAATTKTPRERALLATISGKIKGLILLTLIYIQQFNMSGSVWICHGISHLADWWVLNNVNSRYCCSFTVLEII